MHMSHDFIAKSCPSYEFFVVFGQVRVWERKSAGWGGRGLGWSVGRVRRVRATFLKLLRMRGRVGLNLRVQGRSRHKISTRAGL